MRPNIGATTLLLAALWSSPWVAARGQDARAALRAGHEAYELADFPGAIGSLSRGLDPAAGPRDSLWVVGVHRLADALFDQGHADVAGVWLRWAFRLEPEMQVDTVNFIPEIVSALREARQYVHDTPPLNARVGYEWRWGESASPSESGSLVVQPRDYVINALIAGRATFQSGTTISLPPGSYRVDFSAEGYLAGRLTVEVLPGVRTTLALDLDPAFPALLYVGSRPWGTVRVDGDSIGMTMVAAYRLTPGRHRVRIEREGYMPFDTVVTVAQGDTVRIGTITLRSRVRGQGR